MGTSAKGTLGVVLENLNSPGLVTLYNGAISSSFSLTSQPSGSTGMRLVIVVQGNTSTGTISLAGTNTSGGSINETTPTISLPPAGQNSLVTAFEYVTTNVWASINGGGVTSTGLANAQVTIYGVPAAKYLIPCLADIERVYDYFIPKEARGLLDAETSMQQTINKTAINKIDQALYPEDSLFIGYMGVENSPTITTIPASPTSLASAATTSPINLSTQPTAPGMVLIFTVSGASTAGTITITNGLNQYGVATTESIGASGNGTYYSHNVYSSVPNGSITVTGLSGFSINVTGVYGWQYVFTPDSNALYSSALEWYTGTDSDVVPFGYLTDIEVNFSVDKETTVSLKGGAQDKMPIGNRSTNPLSASQVTALGQPLDIPTIGWQTAVYVDALSGTPQTTAYSDVIDCKIALKVPQKAIWTATQSQRFTRLYRQQRSIMATATIDFVNLSQFEQFRRNIKQFIAFQFFGAYIGSVGGTVYNKSWTWILPAQYSKFQVDATKLENVTASLEAKGIYENSWGASHKLIVICQAPPSYTA